jgi:hypothetical protein
MAEITISDDDIRAVIASATAAQLTPDIMTRLAKEAIEALVLRKGNRTLDESELSRQFKYAAEQVAREAIKVEFDKPEVRAQLGELVTSALAKVFQPGDARDTLEEKLASAISTALSGSRY